MLDPRLDPTIGHVYSTQDRLAGFLWADVTDSREQAAAFRQEIQQVIDASEFPMEYYAIEYTLNLLSATTVVIESNFGDFEPQTVELSEVLAKLDLIARLGASP